MTALLIITLLGIPNVVKSREMSIAQCREDAAFYRERGRVHTQCNLLPSQESYQHKGLEPRKGRMA